MRWDIVRATENGAQMASDLMRDTCVIERESGSASNDFGVVEPVWTVVYVGVCKVQNNRVYPSSPEAGGHSFTVGTNIVSVPVTDTTATIATGDRVTITDSVNPSVVGRRFTVRVDDGKTWQTAIRLNVTEVTG